MVYVYSLPLTPAVILSFVSSQMAPLMQAYKQHELYATVMTIPVAIWYMNARSYVELELPQPPFNLLPAKNVRIYIETAIVVVISYVSLLLVNWSHIWLVVFPIIAIGFIFALCNQLSHQGGSHEQSNEGEATAPSGSGNKQAAEGLEAVALVPYWALCVMGHFHADKFAVSQFLLFFSFMLGALTMMMTRLVGLAATAHRGIAPAAELLRKASLVVLLVAVHSVAAELLGEKALLYCLPEIVPVLLWLSVRLDCDDDRAIIIIATAADRINLDLGRSVLGRVLGAAAAAVLAAMLVDLDESVLYWCGKALVSCAVSALLSLYIVFMLRQWPGGEQQDGTLVTVTDGTLVTVTAAASLQQLAASLQQLAVELLQYWAKVLLAAAATLLVYTSISSFQLVLLQEPASSTDHILRRLCQKFLQFII